MLISRFIYSIYGDGQKNYNKCARRTWPQVRSKWENIKRDVEPCLVKKQTSRNLVFLVLDSISTSVEKLRPDSGDFSVQYWNSAKWILIHTFATCPITVQVLQQPSGDWIFELFIEPRVALQCGHFCCIILIVLGGKCSKAEVGIWETKMKSKFAI